MRARQDFHFCELLPAARRFPSDAKSINKLIITHRYMINEARLLVRSRFYNNGIAEMQAAFIMGYGKCL